MISGSGCTTAASAVAPPSAHSVARYVESRLAFGEPAAATWLRQPYRVHQRLLMAWPDGEAGRVLWRAWPRDGRIIVRHPEPADWDRAFADFYCRPQVEQNEVTAHLTRGDEWRFWLVGNPTKRESDSRNLTSNGVDWRDWLYRKLDAAGAAPLDRIDARRLRADQPRRGNHELTIDRVRFAGDLAVEEPARLAEALSAGIGRGKAFGCGLLLLGEPR